jgi:hypothetical protein
MYKFVFVVRLIGKWNRQIGRSLYKMVVNHCLRILSMCSRCKCSPSNLFILCRCGILIVTCLEKQGREEGLHVDISEGACAEILSALQKQWKQSYETEAPSATKAAGFAHEMVAMVPSKAACSMLAGRSRCPPGYGNNSVNLFPLSSDPKRPTAPAVANFGSPDQVPLHVLP